MSSEKQVPLVITQEPLRTIMIPEERIRAWGYVVGMGRGILRYDFQMSPAQKAYFVQSQTALNARIERNSNDGRTTTIVYPQRR